VRASILSGHCPSWLYPQKPVRSIGVLRYVTVTFRLMPQAYHPVVWQGALTNYMIAIMAIAMMAPNMATI
jgi:hypothetical protein